MILLNISQFLPLLSSDPFSAFSPHSVGKQELFLRSLNRWMIWPPPSHLPLWPNCLPLSPLFSVIRPPLLFLEDIRHGLTSVSLWWPFPWPGVLFPQMCRWSVLSFTSNLHSKFDFSLTSPLHLKFQPLSSHCFVAPSPALVPLWHLQLCIMYYLLTAVCPLYTCILECTPRN